MKRFILAAFLLVLIGATPSFADPLEEGMAAYERGDFAIALRLFRPLAEQGHATGQFLLGGMYHQGFGVQQDYAEAEKWFRKAAEQGHAYAQFGLAGMYHQGWGVPQDEAEAARWLRKAAEQGHAEAQNGLGGMYERGLGVTRSFAEAVKWYRKAAEQGLAIAQYNLGIRHEDGIGIMQDYIQAYMWFSLATAQGDENAAKKRDHLAKDMTPAQIAKAQKLAREMVDANPSLMDPPDDMTTELLQLQRLQREYVLHTLLQVVKEYVQQKFEKFQESIRELFDANSSSPDSLAGPLEEGIEAYEDGDYATAMRLLKPLAEEGDAGAQSGLGAMYYQGEGVQQDYTKALKWTRKAAEQGEGSAQYNLALLYKRGHGVQKDLTQAYLWFSLSAAQGEKLAELFLLTLAEDMTRKEIAEAEKLVQEWKPTQ